MVEKEDQGVILRGINNIYTVGILEEGESGGQEERECRIKGKILEEGEPAYNPLAPGDWVLLRGNQILKRLPRRNSFARWNRKRGLRQVIAANLDRVVCVLSPQSPPFRPRFADRVVIAAQEGGCSVEVILNKADQGLDADQKERMELFQRLGIPTAVLSAVSGEGLEAWAQGMAGKVCVLVGQSGVGKTTLLNRLAPGLNRKVGAVSSKHNRGRHTTSDSLMFPAPGKGFLIDTPGIRELEPWGLDPECLDQAFPDIFNRAEDCRFTPCSHTEEPDCAVKGAVESGAIHRDRYTSYLSLREALERRRKNQYR